MFEQRVNELASLENIQESFVVELVIFHLSCELRKRGGSAGQAEGETIISCPSAHYLVKSHASHSNTG